VVTTVSLTDINFVFQVFLRLFNHRNQLFFYHYTLVVTSQATISGSIIELYRQIAEAIGIVNIKGSRAGMVSMIRSEITEIVSGCKRKVLLIIDEASLLRMEVFAELHTIVQFRQDSEMWLPLILAGQSTLIDRLQYRASSPLSSRVISRSHLEGLNLQDMKEYLNHHIRLAGIDIFTDQAITAIHQGSGGLLRKANHLAPGSTGFCCCCKKRNERICRACKACGNRSFFTP